MRLEEFDYFLPPELIAQEPAAKRDAARLMTLERSSGAIGETGITEISTLLRDGDLLVLNDTRVIPARLFGAKESGGRVEILLVRRLAGTGELWRCLLRASKPPRVGARIILPDGVTAQVEEQDAGEQWTVSFDLAEGFEEWLDRNGAMPLPPYIRRAADDCDRERYQTVFAKVSGAVAAPTAGLHFTPELLETILNRRVDIVPLTLHVGLGTFLPVRVEELQHHRMHQEYYNIPTATAEAINRRKLEGGRVVAVGTTTTRALEQAAAATGLVQAGDGEADIFIFPGYEFKVVDALITNFHLPKSTLLALVAAFAGREFLLRAYAEAVERRFRFYSYGDAMFIH